MERKTERERRDGEKDEERRMKRERGRTIGHGRLTCFLSVALRDLAG